MPLRVLEKHETLCLSDFQKAISNEFFMHDFKTPLIEIKIDIIILNILW